jgi:hypothetical protein
MTERRIHMIDRAKQEGSDRFHRQYSFRVSDRTTLSVEVRFPSGRFNVGFEVSANDEDVVAARVCVPPVSLYFGIDSYPISNLIQLELERLGEKRIYAWKRAIDLRVFDWAVWWHAWVNPDEGKRKRPQWREGSWHPFGFPGSRVGKEQTIEIRSEVLGLPDGVIPCCVRLYRERRRSQVLPWIVEEGRGVSFDFREKPVDTGHSKGPVWGMSVPAESIEDGIYRMRARILEERARNGYVPARATAS